MPTLERRVLSNAHPDALRPALAAVEGWPRWCPLVRAVEPARQNGGPDDAWSIVALLGGLPYSAIARLTLSAGGDQVALATLAGASPVDHARYTFTIVTASGTTLILRVDYRLTRGPGGWLVDRLLVRRRLAAQIDAALAALAQGATG